MGGKNTSRKFLILRSNSTKSLMTSDSKAQGNLFVTGQRSGRLSNKTAGFNAKGSGGCSPVGTHWEKFYKHALRVLKTWLTCGKKTHTNKRPTQTNRKGLRRALKGRLISPCSASSSSAHQLYKDGSEMDPNI